MVTISRFVGLLKTDAEAIQIDLDQWLDSLALEPSEDYSGQFYHPGWSPVLYDPPKRAASNVRHVYALVLDHDDGATWNSLATLWQQSAGVIYTTKSHTADKPRYRVILALSRPVSPLEYAKIWRWGADRSAAASCPVDEQCKDVSRFWYDPTTPPGGWRAQRLSGSATDPDVILAAAPAPPQLRVVRTQATPTPDDKIRRARAYLAKIPGGVSGSSGHTATFNAVAAVLLGFDLSEPDALRLITEDYNPRCDPPWSEKDLQHKISSAAQRCKRERGYLLTDRSRVSDTRSAAAQAPQPAEDLDVDWASKLLVSDKNKTRKAYYNTALFVRHHPEFRGRWSMDLMTRLPWFDDTVMDPSMVHHIRGQADCRLGYTPPATDVEAAIVSAAMDRQFHPIRQYLRSLDWDGEPRLSAMARDYFDSDDALHSTMLRMFMIGAAARALWPGCKHDTALMLVGAQGTRKSTFFKILGGSWHSDTYLDLGNHRDATMQLHGAWIYELSELENVLAGKAESRMKAWTSSTHDNVRLPYMKTTSQLARGTVLAGTTNRTRFLTDETGSRRSWIIPVTGMIPFQLLESCRDQLWAEACAAAEAGEPWWLDGSDDRAREDRNQAYIDEDSWEEIIALWTVGREITSMSETLSEALKLDVGKHDRSSQMRVAKALRRLDWVRRRRGGIWVYERTIASNVPS